MRKSLILAVSPFENQEEESELLKKSGTIDLDSFLPSNNKPKEDENKSKAVDVKATILTEIPEEQKDAGFGDYGDSSDDDDDSEG